MYGLNRLLKLLKDCKKHSYEELEKEFSNKIKLSTIMREAEVKGLVLDYKMLKKIRITAKGLEWLIKINGIKN